MAWDSVSRHSVTRHRRARYPQKQRERERERERHTHRDLPDGGQQNRDGQAEADAEELAGEIEELEALRTSTQRESLARHTPAVASHFSLRLYGSAVFTPRSIFLAVPLAVALYSPRPAASPLRQRI